MSAEDYKKISFGFRPDNRFFIFRDAAAKKTENVDECDRDIVCNICDISVFLLFFYIF